LADLSNHVCLGDNSGHPARIVGNDDEIDFGSVQQAGSVDQERSGVDGRQPRSSCRQKSVYRQHVIAPPIFPNSLSLGKQPLASHATA
jgi:hypothetical protein